MENFFEFLQKNWGTISISTFLTTVITTLMNYLYFSIRHRAGQYEYIESQVNNLLKIQLENPHFRDEEYCNYITDTKGEDHLQERRKYDAYCCLVWNTLETMHEKYGSRGLKKSTFFPALENLAQRHQKWLFLHGGASNYKLEMIVMLLKNKTVK